MEIPVYIRTDKYDENVCDINCPFLNYTECLLFKEDLDETELKEDEAWQDEIVPTRDRCYRCLTIS